MLSGEGRGSRAMSPYALPAWVLDAFSVRADKKCIGQHSKWSSRSFLKPFYSRPGKFQRHLLAMYIHMQLNMGRLASTTHIGHQGMGEAGCTVMDAAPLSMFFLSRRESNIVGQGARGTSCTPIAVWPLTLLWEIPGAQLRQRKQDLMSMLLFAKTCLI